MEKIVEKVKQLFQQNNRIWKLCVCGLMAVAAIGLCVSGVRTYRRNRAAAALERLAENTDTALPLKSESAASDTAGLALPSAESGLTGLSGSDMQALADMGIPVPEKEIDFADLQANVNRDIYAWIDIPDTRIDYPVLQHPTDNFYYLNYNMDGSKGYPGCIYTEDYNTRDFTDPNTVLYGHNMKDGSMFAGLHQYEDREYFDTHPYVYVYTEDRLYVYEIFAAYEYDDDHILYNCDFTDQDAFESYLENIYDMESIDSRTNIREDRAVTAEDHILTLSTCVSHEPDRRYLVQGVLLNRD